MRKMKLVLVATASLGAAAVSLVWLFAFIHFQVPGDGGPGAVARNAAIVTFWCLLHSLLAREGVKDRVARIIGAGYVRLVYNAVAAVTLMAVLYLWVDLPGLIWSVDGVLYWVLSGLYGICIAGMVYSVFSIGIVENTGLSSFMKKANARDRAIRAPATTGPYACCRHPFYLFYMLALVTGPVMTAGRVEFALLNILYCLLGAFFEERSLRREFGPLYDTYRLKVPMWIPRLLPGRQHHTYNLISGGCHDIG